MTSSIPLYKSLPLDLGSDSVRLLSVSATEQDIDEIYGSLQVFDLDSAPQFTALSYVWDTGVQRKHILNCSDHVLELHENCWSALWHLRKSLGSFVVWVDSVCIDQTNTSERSQQIQLMGRIFGIACPVYLWFGEENRDTGNVFKILRNTGFQSTYHFGDASVPSKPSRRVKLLLKAARFPHRSLSGVEEFDPWITRSGFRARDHLRRSVTSFLLRNWVERIWTLQEVVLAKDPVFCCGLQKLPWRHFMYTIVYLETIYRYFNLKGLPARVMDKWLSLLGLWISIHHPTSTSTPDEDDLLKHSYFKDYVADITWLFSTRMLTILRRPRSKPEMRGLHLSQTQEAVVYEILSRKCKQGHDKSFGMHGVLTALGVKLPPPDYNTRIWQVYGDLFLRLHAWGLPLNLLLLAGTHEEMGWPSWVPDWNVDWQSSWIDKFQVVSQAYPLGVPDVVQNTTENPARHVSLGDLEGLVVTARHVTTIEWCSVPPASATLITMSHSLGTFMLRAVASHSLLIQHSRLRRRRRPCQWSRETTYGNVPYKFGTLNPGTLQTVIDKGVPRTSYEEPVYYINPSLESPEFDGWSRDLWSARNLLPENVFDLFRWEMSDQPPFTNLKGYKRFEAWHLVMATKGRTLFLTQERLMGNGPEDAMVGDLIMTVHGVRMPLVLRPHGDYFKLIGYADIEGMMDCRLWPSGSMGGGAKEIILC